MLRTCFIIIIAVYTIHGSEKVPTVLKEYGSFNLSITEFNVCKGPKQKDCATSTATVKGYATLLYNLTVHKSTTPKLGKIIALSNGKEFLRLQVKNPCDHLFLRPLFMAIMNASVCVFQKGVYYAALDIQSIAQSYFGDNFLFGNWAFKSLFYNSDCNLSCSNIKVAITPANKGN